MFIGQATGGVVSVLFLFYRTEETETRGWPVEGWGSQQLVSGQKRFWQVSRGVSKTEIWLSFRTICSSALRDFGPFICFNIFKIDIKNS